MLAVNQLIGFGAFSASVAALTTVTFRSSASANSNEVVAPSDIVAGDILVLLDNATNKVSFPSETVPSGFTIISSITDSTRNRQILSYKIADGSEASATLTGLDGEEFEGKILAVFAGDVPILTVTPQDVNGQFTIGNPTAQVININGDTNVPLIVFGAYGNWAATVSPRTYTGTGASASELSIGVGTNLYLKYEIFNSVPSADRTIDMDDEGLDNCLQSCYLECA